jgi:hypothetical protein
MSVAEALHIATQEIARIRELPEFAGKIVRVKVFNDNLYNLEYLEGKRRLPRAVLALAKPVLDLISQQSRALKATRGVQVRLSLHWIPGHGHGIRIHKLADEIAGSARRHQVALSTLGGNSWRRWQDPVAVTLLAEELAAAAVRAGRMCPEYRRGTLPPRAPAIVPSLPTPGPATPPRSTAPPAGNAAPASPAVPAPKGVKTSDNTPEAIIDSRFKEECVEDGDVGNVAS